MQILDFEKSLFLQKNKEENGWSRTKNKGSCPSVAPLSKNGPRLEKDLGGGEGGGTTEK